MHILSVTRSRRGRQKFVDMHVLIQTNLDKARSGDYTSTACGYAPTGDAEWQGVASQALVSTCIPGSKA